MISDMYKAFYGLNDNPFSIAPNPHYLFLSDRHREALAHLTYGLGETGGFVLLTGEVGTGKTTVSRCLLSQLPENTDTAFILNPSLSEADLLASLCDELEISYGKNPTAKQLTDNISQFLLKNHEKGRQTVLIIDEAQHLSPEVLEQLRLLTNLETDTEKLMQVVLIGQPELQLLLKRQELRQLAQRISARYHLLPLTSEEVGLYVQHRLQIAGRLEPLFTKSAMKELFRVTKGVPRLINLICERSLMAGYVQSKVPIDKKMIRLAGIEILGKVPDAPRSYWPLVLAGSFVIAFVGIFLLMQSRSSNPVIELKGPIEQQVQHNESINQQVQSSSTITKSQIQDSLMASAPSMGSNVQQFASSQPHQVNRSQQVAMMEFTNAIANSRNIDSAYAALLGRWGKVQYRNMSACSAAQKQGLACLSHKGTLKNIEMLNYPAVVNLLDDQKQVFFGALISVNSQKNELLLQLSDKQFWVKTDWFTHRFTGKFDVIWKPNGNTPKHIGPKSSVTHLQWLETSLAHITAQPLRIVSRYDDLLKTKIETFQRHNGLQADGIAGKQTLQLLKLYLNQQGPRLSDIKEQG